MKRFLILSALVAFACGNIVQPKTALPDGRIVGGENATVEQYPFIVSVRVRNIHMCGGSIIAPNRILTAAHCCGNLASLYTVQYGVTDKGGSSNVIAVDQVKKHPGYNANTIDNDACVLVLKSPITYSKVAQAIVLADKDPSAGAKAEVTGWGTLTESGSSPTTLQKVGVDIIDRDDCSKAYAAFGGVTSSMLCAGVKNGGKDACQGDSGGPLISGGVLVGIVSWGYGCARPGYPGVYACVSALQNWIVLQ